MIFTYLAFGMPLAAILLGLALAAAALQSRRRAFACAAWPTASGRIMGARVDTQIVDNFISLGMR